MADINIIEFEDEKDREKIYKEISVNTYVPYIVKREAIDMIIDSFLHEENGMYIYEPMEKHLMFVLGFVSLYTNLFYEEGTGYQAFDILMSQGIVDYVVKEIGIDYNDFLVMFEETLERRIEYNNSIPNRLATLLGMFEKTVSSWDQEKIMKLLESLEE